MSGMPFGVDSNSLPCQKVSVINRESIKQSFYSFASDICGRD